LVLKIVPASNLLDAGIQHVELGPLLIGLPVELSLVSSRENLPATFG